MTEPLLPVSRAVVISLPGSDRRPGFFAQPLSRAFEVSEAFAGATQDWSALFSAERFTEVYGRPPQPGEIGCAISHARVIRNFAAGSGAGSDVLLVAEDDARFTEDTERVLCTLLGTRLRHDVVVLADGWSLDPRLAVRQRFMSLSQISALSSIHLGWRRVYRVGRYAGLGDRTGLYMITRQGARKFVAYVRRQEGEKLAHVADAWSQFHDDAGLDVALVRPSLATWSGGSTIRKSGDLSREAAEQAASQRRTLRQRVTERVAVRSRARGAKLAVRATAEDLRCRRQCPHARGVAEAFSTEGAFTDDPRR